jgi:AraC-like DNA-binding protein
MENECVYFTVVCSRLYNNSTDLHVTYEKIIEILKHRKFIQRNQFLTEDILKERLDGFYFPVEQQELFSNLLSNLKQDECLQLIDSIFDKNYKMEVSEFCIYLLYVQFMDCCSNVMMQIYNKVPKNLPFIDSYLYNGQCTSIEDYKIRYRSIIIECINYISKNQRESDYIVDYVKRYINENYGNDINVNFLAEKLRITRTYLSWYFKNRTGMNLSDYLNSYRITKACVLLRNSLLKIKDIAPEVGIYSTSTFMRLFKQHTGMTPNDYRNCNLH